MTQWLAVIISALALLLTGLGYLGNRREAQGARQAAERSAVRADQAVAAQQRMAEALEAQTPKRTVSWALAHFDGDAYLLNSIGTADAHEVHLALGEMNVAGNTWDYAHVSAGDTCKFFAIRRIGMKDDIVTVSWLNSPTGSERTTWRHPLPVKPGS